MKRLLKFATILGLVLASFAPTKAQTGGAGTFRAVEYGQWTLQVTSSGSNPANDGLAAGGGSYALTVANGGSVVAPSGNPGGARFVPVAIDVPITVGVGASQETVTPTAVSGCSYTYVSPTGCSITATFTYGHGPGAQIISGDAGLQEAINAASGFNTYAAGSTYSNISAPAGGTVVIDRQWNGTNANLKAALVFSNVTLMDTRNAAVQYWNPTPTAATVLATPTALTGQAACDATHTFCSDATVAGSASWGSTVYGCVTYVDIMGQESPACSTTASFTSVASMAIDIGMPAASTGAVGWKPYLSVSGGSYALTYSLPLLTQPTVLGTLPVANTVCTLTTLETITPACALTNATYGQTGSGGIVFTGYPVVTSQLSPNLGSVSATTYNANADGHTVYSYVPGSHLGVPGIVAASEPFPITAAAQTAVGEIAGSVNIPPNFMNYVGRNVQVCGLFYKTSTTADTTTTFTLYWDAEGSNVSAGTPVAIGILKATYGTALAAAADYHVCFNVVTTVAAATATGGTLFVNDGTMVAGQVSAGANPSPGVLLTPAAVGSLNLALNAHFSILYNHATGTDGAGGILEDLTITVLN